MNDSRSTDIPYVQAVARRVAPLFVVFVLWLLGAGLTVQWLRADTTPPAWDEAVHLGYSLNYYAYLTRLSTADAWAGLGVTSLYYPPLVHVVGAFCYQLFGVIQPTVAGLSPAEVPVLGNLLFLALLLFSTYSLAARWYGSTAGLLAAALVACYPVLGGQSRLFLLDYPLTSLTVTCMALLAATDDLTHPVWVWPLGVAAGAAFWCKWSFLFIFAAPLALALANGVRRVRAGDDEAVTWIRLTFNLVVVLTGMLLIAGPWYLSHPGATVQELQKSNLTWLIDETPARFTLAGLTFYPRMLLSGQIFLPFTLLALFGGLMHWARRYELKGGALLLAWLLGGLVVFTLVSNKSGRFTMPLLPALAVVSASWLAPPPNGRRESADWLRTKSILLALTLCLALGELLAVACGVPGLPARIGPRWAPLWSEQAFLTRHPARFEWPHNALVQDLARLTPPGGKIGVLPNTAQINHLTLRYYVLWQFLPYLPDTKKRVPKVDEVVHLVDHRPEPATPQTLADDGYDVVLTMDGPQGAHTELIDATVRNLDRDRDQFLALYEPVAEHVMPGGEKIHLYRRRGPAPTQDATEPAP